MDRKDLREALTKAVAENSPGRIRLLVHQGANILEEFPDGSTYLHMAVKSKSLDVIPTLVELGIPVDSETTCERYTPMEEACKTDNVNIMEILKSLGANIFWEDSDCETFLHKAAFYGANNAIDWLLGNGLLIETRGNSGNPLHSAAVGGHYSTVKKFLDLGVDVNSVCQGLTPIHWAVCRNHLNVLLLLITCGGNVNACTTTGHTPLHWAVQNASAECVELLLSHGAAIDKAGDKGDTPLHWAAESGNLLACRVLLNHGANVSKCDKKGRFPLCLAEEKNQKEIIEEISSQGDCIFI